MKITKLMLNNFSSYEGINIFDFTTTPRKTIVLIGGQNGAGKTSIFDAIKIALYGPLAFGYSGANSHYSKKIKEYINSKTYNKADCNSGVAIEFEIKQDREVKKYTINRQWTIDDKKLKEDCIIECGGKKYDESEHTYFESYLQSVIPPNLFDFFLFDGEEVGNLFSDDGYNKFIKDALLTLCGIDTYAIIQKFCSSYIGKSEDDVEQQIKEEYAECMKAIHILTEKIRLDNVKIQNNQKRIEEMYVANEQLNESYKRAGGISEKDKSHIQAEIDSLDKKRNEISADLKSFMEDTMPFFLLKSFNADMESQIDFEEKDMISEYVRLMISKEYLKSILVEKTDNAEQLSEDLFNAINNKISPKGDNDVERILDFSRDEISAVESVMTLVDSIDIKTLSRRIKERSKYTKKVISLNQKLREALSEEDAQNYLSQIHNNEEEIKRLENEIHQLTQLCESNNLLIKEYSTKKDLLYKKILDTAANKHAYALSSDIAEIMGTLIDSKTKSIRKKLAKYTVENLSEIYRKDNLITSIDISEDFKITLYQKLIYSVDEIKSAIYNIGLNEFFSQIDEASQKHLLEQMKIKSVEEINFKIHNIDEKTEFTLNRRIELTRLSKGERQIFILALYQAMIKISNNDIPFVIDTPYARIDAIHREEISKKFFPKISKQVIILSTDEEITEDYYPIIKPYIAQEYLLSNNQSENRTSIEKRYFFEV